MVQKTGKGLPDDGIKEFWPDYPKMSRVEKENRTQIEHQRVVSFSSRWNDVLTKLGLEKLIANPQATNYSFGGSGESAQHKELKEYVRQHPELVGANSDWLSFVDYPLPSMDLVDVLFKCVEKCIAVEVKSAISDCNHADYERGLYQTIRYGALLKAMALSGSHDIPSTIETVLVLESVLPEEYRRLAEVLRVGMIEHVSIPHMAEMTQPGDHAEHPGKPVPGIRV